MKTAARLSDHSANKADPKTGSAQLLDGAIMPRVWPELIVDTTDAEGVPGGDTVILLHPTKAYWALTNHVGSQMAQQFDGSCSVNDVIDSLHADYPNVMREQLRSDVTAFLQQLHAARLLDDTHSANQQLPFAPPAPRPAPQLPPYNLAFFLTEQCNLRCKHCFVVEGTMPADTLTTDDVKRLIDEHARLHDQISVTFSGGEVTLHPDWLDLVEHAEQHGAGVTVCSNALLIDESAAQAFSKFNARLQVSLDGPDPTVHDFIRGAGSFEKTWASLQLLVKHCPDRLSVSCTLTKSVLGHVQEFLHKLNKIGVREARFLPLLKQRAAETHWDAIAPDPAEVQAIYRWLICDLHDGEALPGTRVSTGFPGFVPEIDPEIEAWCPLGRMTLIDAQGKAYNCPSMNTPEFELGDARTEGLEALQQGERNRELRQRVLDRRWAVPECATCSWRNFCQGSCAALSYMKTNDWFVNDEFCEFRRELYRRHVLRTAKQ